MASGLILLDRLTSATKAIQRPARQIQMIIYEATLSCDGANCQAMTSGDPSAQYYRTAVEAYDEAKALGWTRRFKDAERRYEAWLCPECRLTRKLKP